MKDAIGGSMLLNLVLIISGVIVLLFIGVLSYSKAYGVKNRIIEIIEKYGTYEEIEESTNLNVVTEELNSDLLSIGYDADQPKNCEVILGRLTNKKYGSGIDVSKGNLNKYGYNYCVFEVNNMSVNESGKFYVVVTFVKFEFPVIGDLITFPVYSETKYLGKTYGY